MRSIRLLLITLTWLCSMLAAQTNSIPYVNTPLIPMSAAPGSAGFELTIHGTGFVAGSVVNWNGSPRVTTFISASQLQAAILSTDLASVGTASITVTNLAPGGGISNIANFSVTLPAPGVGFASTTNSESKNCNNSVLYPAIVADINGDGKLDVVGSTCIGGYVYVALGNGDGTFQAPIYTATLPTSNYGMTVADFNADGKMDIAILNQENNLAILLGNGDGTFQPAKNYLTGVEPNSITTGDFNGDGKLDIILSADTNNEIDVLLGNGDGTFQPYLSSPTGGANTYGVAVGDFNGDGKLDVATGSGAGEVMIMLGNGDGTFHLGNYYFANFYGVTTADINGDGKLDLISLGTPADGGYAGIMAMFGNGDGTFQNAFEVAVPPLNINYMQFGLADLNGDGKIDIWATSRYGENEGDSIVSFLGNGDGTFQAPNFYPITIAGYVSSGIVEGDFNQDGKPDFQDANDCLSIACTLVALQSPVVASPSAIVFSTQLIGVRGPAQSVTLYNSGLSVITISSISLAGTNYKDFFQANTCTGSLASGTGCTIHVGFDPSLEDYQETAYLSIVDSGPGGGQQVQLSGIGTYIKVSPKTLNFGNVAVGSNATLTATLTNTATTSKEVGRIYFKSGSKEFSETNTCGRNQNLAAGAQCTITVTFAPTATGRVGAQLDEEFYGDAPPPIQLSGTGN